MSALFSCLLPFSPSHFCCCYCGFCVLICLLLCIPSFLTFTKLPIIINIIYSLIRVSWKSSQHKKQNHKIELREEKNNKEKYTILCTMLKRRRRWAMTGMEGTAATVCLFLLWLHWFFSRGWMESCAPWVDDANVIGFGVVVCVLDIIG